MGLSPPASMVMAAAMVILILAPGAMAGARLREDYYAKTCPKLDDIVSQTVIAKQINNPTTAAAALRLFFHDCFLDGCDGSVLISSNTFNKAERDADINLSLPGDGFDVVVRAKSAVELACPGVVSCADILALATRNLVTMLGGPYYRVLLGRKDSLISHADAVEGHIPRSNVSVSNLIDLFAKKGLSVQDLVALSGTHTVGFSHCKEFAERVGLEGRRRRIDPAAHPKFADGIRKACSGYVKDPTLSVFNDMMTPNKFDNMYYKNLLRGLGLLATDQALASDPRTRRFVRLYADKQDVFFRDFVRAIEKLSLLGGSRDGEIRRRCDAFNTLSTP